MSVLSVKLELGKASMLRKWRECTLNLLPHPLPLPLHQQQFKTWTEYCQPLALWKISLSPPSLRICNLHILTIDQKKLQHTKLLFGSTDDVKIARKPLLANKLPVFVCFFFFFAGRFFSWKMQKVKKLCKLVPASCLRSMFENNQAVSSVVLMFWNVISTAS